MTRTSLQTILDQNSAGVPGSVALRSRAGAVEVATSGHFDVERSAPMQRDTIFRIASMTKPLIAAAVLQLIDDGRVQLGDPIADWIPELAGVDVLRTPSSELDDVVSAERPVSVRDILASTAGWGFAEQFDTPAMKALFEIQLGPLPAAVPPVDRWLEVLAGIPLLDQPGQTWLYNTCSDLQGILIARVSGQSLPDFLVERLFDPLGMVDTAFWVPPAERHRLPTFYGRGESGALDVMDPPDGDFSEPPAFPSGAGGLTSTLDDWHAFAQLLLGRGEARGRRLLSARAVDLMTTNHLTPAQRQASGLFIEGQGWGFGGAVDVEPIDPWNIPGRYGWVGGTGTAGHIVPSTGTATIVLTQVAMSDPTYPEIMRSFWAATV